MYARRGEGQGVNAPPFAIDPAIGMEIAAAMVFGSIVGLVILFVLAWKTGGKEVK